MDVIKAAYELRNLLVAHDRTVQVIKTLEDYIDQKRMHLLYQDLDLNHSDIALHISIATGVRQMYEHYRATKLQKVQKLSQFILSTLAPDQDTDQNITHQATTETQVPNDTDHIASQLTRDSIYWYRAH